MSGTTAAASASPGDAVLDKDAALSSLPPEWPDEALTETIADRVARGNETIVVLDDDPTGTQTVYDLPVLTEWTVELIEDEFGRGTPAFYILTNSRSMSPPDAADLNETIARRLLSASSKRGRNLSVVSRSDSCLRGHYPLEIDVLARTLGEEGEGSSESGGRRPIDGQIIVPFFYEGGRLTLNDVHYVAEGDSLIPAAMTPFAKDAAFGFTKSNLKHYVEEKTDGKVRKEDVVSVTIDDLRVGGPERVRTILSGLTNLRPCVVNAASIRDMEVFALGMLESEARDGKRFLARSAASFVQARIGLPKRPVLGADVINNTSSNGQRGGLVVVGSYVPKTTAQLGQLLKVEGLEKIELDVSVLVDPGRREATLKAASDRAEEAMSSGRTAVVYTSRELVTGNSAEESLAIGNTVSDGLVKIVSNLKLAPRFIIAKGGITSSDVATKGLGIRRAMVLGSAAPGVPVWSIGDEGKFPGMSYVVFPGNVGANDELAKLVLRLTA